jgi:hypothetical protein
MWHGYWSCGAGVARGYPLQSATHGRLCNQLTALNTKTLYSRVTKRLAFLHQSKKNFKSAIFESVSNAQKLSPALQIWTIDFFISQLHVC